MTKELTVKPELTLFDIGVNNVSKLLIRLMLVAVPLVFFINLFDMITFVVMFFYYLSKEFRWYFCSTW